MKMRLFSQTTYILFGCAIIGALSILPLASAGKVAPGPLQRKFDPDGFFMLVGNPPAGFEDFDGISLLRKPEGGHWPASGVHNNRNVVYRFIAASTVVSRQKFSFDTMAVRGVSYSFTGRFLKGGVYAEDELDMETPVLEGHLIKYRRGQKVAEADMKFTYFAGT
jgi:hypothetical protein